MKTLTWLFRNTNILFRLFFLITTRTNFVVSAGCSNNDDGGGCVSPYCECQPLFPWFPQFLQREVCLEGYSGDHCRCSWEPTNIAKRPIWQFFPDSLTGSLAVSVAANEDDTILAGTWKSGYEWQASSYQFQDILRTNQNGGVTENVWSVTKTIRGSYLLGTPMGILRKGNEETDFQEVYWENNGVQGQFAELDDHSSSSSSTNIFAGTFEGLYHSVDDGNTWLRTPTTCAETEPVVIENDNDLIPKPPTISWCQSAVNYVFTYHDKYIIAFFDGYGGPYYLDATSTTNKDPQLESSWIPLPKFQNGNVDAPCISGFCHVNDATVFQNYLYVTFMSNTVYRLPMASYLDTTTTTTTNDDTWERIYVSETADNQGTNGVTTLPDENRIYVSTIHGLYSSETGDSNTWDAIPTESCSDRKTPPGLSRGLVSTSNGKQLLVGTLYGPWIYTVG